MMTACRSSATTLIYSLIDTDRSTSEAGFLDGLLWLDHLLKFRRVELAKNNDKGLGMISRKTVFVIGAGASCVYGFPSGASLLLDARDQTEKDSMEYTHGAARENDIRSLRSALAGTMNSSLDAFLEFRADLAETGRMYIAGRILAAESRHRPNSRDFVEFDWLSYLFERMDEGCRSLEEFSSNNVTFVTYNYDRLIEHRLGNALRAKWSHVTENIEEAIEAYWAKHPIVHLHGSLGSLQSVPYGSNEAWTRDSTRFDLFRRSFAGIKIIHEANGDDKEFQKARRALVDADRVFFLGFRFARNNVDRLAFSNISYGAHVVCCRYGMTDAEVAVDILEPFKRCKLREPETMDADCLSTIRARVNLLVDRYA